MSCPCGGFPDDCWCPAPGVNESAAAERAVIEAARAIASGEALDVWWHDDECICAGCTLIAAVDVLDGMP